MGSWETFSLLDGLILKIPYSELDLIIFNCKLGIENIVFSHIHHCYEMYMVLEGSFDFLVDGKHCVLNEGDLCWICPGVQHADYYSRNQKHKQVIITFDFIPSNSNPQNSNSLETKELKSILKQANANRYWVGKDTRNCRQIFELICDELSRCEVGSYLKVTHLVSNLILGTLQCMQLTPSGYQHPLKEARITNKARQITMYIDKHHSEDITLEIAANDLNITSRHINRILNEHLGTTFSKMLVITRLAYAKMYLINTDYSIEKIAELVGFSSSRILYKYFREIEGCTIAKYRELQNRVL